MKVAFRRPAANELRAAMQWYERQRAGLGAEFAAEIEVVVETIGTTPKICQVIDPDRQIRRALTRRFPYAVYYLLEPTRVVVLAVLHVARDPGVWQERP